MSSKKSTSHKKKGNLSTDTSSKPTVQQIGDFFNHHGLAVNAILFLIFFNILIRFSVGLETYSGKYQSIQAMKFKINFSKVIENRQCTETTKHNAIGWR